MQLLLLKYGGESWPFFIVHLIELNKEEFEWRKARGQLEGFGTMLSSKPIVAVGADHPLEDEILMADYFRMYPTLDYPKLISNSCARWD